MARRTGDDSSLIRNAEQLGRLLGTVAAKLSRWKKRHGELPAHLSDVVRDAQGMLNDLGVPTRSGRARRSAPGGAKRGGPKTGSKASSRPKTVTRARKRTARPKRQQ